MSNLEYIMFGIVVYILYNVVDYPCANVYTVWSSNIHTTDIFQFLAIFAQNLAIYPKIGGASFPRSLSNFFCISETS